MPTYTLAGGQQEPMFTAPVAPDLNRVDRGTTLDSIGSAYEAGKTYYDFQHNGSAGRMIYVDDAGLVHMVWMKGITSTLSGARHVFYQIWDPTTEGMRFLTGGVPFGVAADGSAARSGYTSLAGLPQGWVYPAYHENRANVGPASSVHSAVTADYAVGMGAWAASYPALCNVDGGIKDVIWPKISVSRHDSILHMVSTESPPTTSHGWQRIYYSRGTAQWDDEGNGAAAEWSTGDCGGFMLIDTVTCITPVVIASQYSDRVAILWSHPRDSSYWYTVDSVSQHNNDLMAMFSEDGGLNWGPKVNITNFVPEDHACLAQAQNMDDSLACAHDTFRVYDDCIGMFDHNDVFHAAFTTEGSVNIWGRGYNRVMWFFLGQVWHWSESTYGAPAAQEISPIANMVFPDSSTWSLTNYIGAWQLSVQRPCLAEDPTTGYLYCSYQWYDTLHVSAGGWPNGEAFVSMSRNGGRSWSEGTNVSQTTPREGAAANQCKSERDITIAEQVTYENGVGYLHMEYVYDLDAGGSVQTSPVEGAVTHNPVRYQKIPIDQIAAMPIVPIDGFILHADSTAMPGHTDPTFDPEGGGGVDDHGQQTLNPASFKLFQNYPNPFNPTTNIQFDLLRDARVSLKVFNVLGENVATLYDGGWLTAGTKTATFDATHLASGVYVYRLEVNGQAESLKMVLMK
jgi:hypothetical protein